MTCVPTYTLLIAGPNLGMILAEADIVSSSKRRNWGG